jgi:hypothetical protein
MTRKQRAVDATAARLRTFVNHLRRAPRKERIDAYFVCPVDGVHSRRQRFLQITPQDKPDKKNAAAFAISSSTTTT